jgi:MmoB/DmpM family
MSDHASVGPVLRRGIRADALVAAIRSLNPDARVVDRGGYLRVSATGTCRVTRAAIEAEIGAPFALPSDLEDLMVSFTGAFTVTEDEAVWHEEAP